MSEKPNILSDEININFKSVSDIQRKLGLSYFNACSIQNALTSAHYEDMSGYQWHDAEKELPKENRYICAIERCQDEPMFVGKFRKSSWDYPAPSLYREVSANHFPDALYWTGVLYWAYIYIPPIKSKEEKQ